MNQDVKARVFKVIEKSLRIPKENIQLDQVIKDICPQSLDLVSLIFDFEDEFNVSISNEEIQELKTVRDIVVNVEAMLVKNHA